MSIVYAYTKHGNNNVRFLFGKIVMQSWMPVHNLFWSDHNLNPIPTVISDFLMHIVSNTVKPEMFAAIKFYMYNM